jgi:hypothetical protein
VQEATMPTDLIDVLKAKFKFDEWQGINRLNRELSVHDLLVPAGLLPGLEPARVREIDPGDGTRLLRASWRLPNRVEDVLLLMDLRECASRVAAHRVLLELLANMQSPNVRRLEADFPGDVAFAPSPSSIIFARANVAVSIGNGGKTIVPVDEAARTVDQWIIQQR